MKNNVREYREYKGVSLRWLARKAGCGASTLCDISRAAADFRWSRMQELYRRQRFLTSPLERLVYAQFEDYIKGHRLRGVGQ